MGDGGGGFFRGTSAVQDARFSDKYKKYVAGRKFPPEFDVKVDLKKVAMDAIKPWVAARITQLLGFEDEVLIGFAFGLLDDKESLNPRELQLNLDGFLEADSPQFVSDLWKLLLSAQTSPGGIPAEFLEQKKTQLRQKREEESRVKSDLSDVISGDNKRVLHGSEQHEAHPPVPTPPPISAGHHTKASLPYGLFVPDAKQSSLAQTDLIEPSRQGSSLAAASLGRQSDESSHSRNDSQRFRERDNRDRRGDGIDRSRERRRDRDRDKGRRDRRERSVSKERRSSHRERPKDSDKDRRRGPERNRGNDGEDRKESKERTKRKRNVDDDNDHCGKLDHHEKSSPTKRTRPGGASSATQQESERKDGSLLLESALREQAMHSLLHRGRDHSDLAPQEQ